ncbi:MULTISPECIES: cytochrome P450 [unclassified Tenacibaculum]|uniref:cytochrome P450 n=1 Tax=unclassified Tenacibaculum TaxID=2635139 RepID=UPI001F323B51|nr:MULTISPECIES: cytochrome P450 [unclassified Tenacibaculum]MCF2875696.1 cytochrome P450 [Tenacibaculum sp. Cn5-1]MCF2935772.1 cytochrome P450 [Tenacibaculum sp. Cn5-34]MCG7512332.1 cytochrome P450 [Tenacibaculum sp. Cn5-46]
MDTLTKTIKDLNTPKGSFLLGNLKDFKKKNKHRILEQWAKEHGEFFTVKLGPLKALVSANVDFNNTVLKQRPDTFRRLSKINEVFIEMGFHTVFNAEGAHWKKQRKPVAEALSVKKVKGYYPIIQEKTKNLISKVEGYATQSNTVDIINDFIAFTIDVTTEIAFGYKLNTIHNKEDRFQNYLELIFPMINERITAPIPMWRILPSAKDRLLKKSLKEIETIIYDFINEAKVRLANNPELKEAPSNFLEALLVESEKEDTVFDEKTLYGNVIAMLLAGEDTTSNTLGWTLYYLTQHPEIVQKIREEASQYDGFVPDNYDVISSLKYTNAVIQEAIRLKPTTPMLYFQANEATTVNNIAIPKDTSIILLNSYAAMEEDYFSNSNDFDPNRWLKSECPYHKNHTPKAIKAFGGGSRLCPGMHLSIIEMTTAISSICKQFDLSLSVKPEKVEENFAFTVYPENLKVQFKKANL